MSLYVLNTDVLSLLERNHPRVVQRRRSVPPNDVVIAVISVEEQLAGWYTLLRKANQPAELERAYRRLIDSLKSLAALPILPFTIPAIARFQGLLRLKLNVRAMDLRIAAIVLEHGGVVVTRNLRDFGRVPGLIIEDWTV